MAGNNALSKITTRAKQIRKASGGTWKAAVKKAGAEYRSGKISGTRKKVAAPKKKITRVKARTAVVITGTKKKTAKKRSTGGGFSIGAVAITQVRQEHQNLQRYTRELEAARGRKAPKALISSLQKLIKTTKQHITALKRSI